MFSFIMLAVAHILAIIAFIFDKECLFLISNGLFAAAYFNLLIGGVKE